MEMIEITIPPIEETLQEIPAAALAGFGERLVSIVLFGSHARGEAREDSDVDLLIIAEGLPARPILRNQTIRQFLPEGLRGRVSILAKTPGEFSATLPGLYLDIALDGNILYDKDNFANQKLAALRQLTQKKGLERNKVGNDFVWSWAKFPGFNWTLAWDEVDE